jgi:hypothetical protein
LPGWVCGAGAGADGQVAAAWLPTLDGYDTIGAPDAEAAGTEAPLAVIGPAVRRGAICAGTASAAGAFTCAGRAMGAAGGGAEAGALVLEGPATRLALVGIAIGGAGRGAADTTGAVAPNGPSVIVCTRCAVTAIARAAGSTA